MLNLSCLCGQVRVELGKRPDHINSCNCSLCSKSGAEWTNCDPSDVRVTGKTCSFSREDKDDPAAQVHFCPRCGCTTHFTLTPSAVARYGAGMMGVNMRLADENDLAGVERRFPDGRAWTGEGAFTYVRDAETIGQQGGSGEL